MQHSVQMPILFVSPLLLDLLLGRPYSSEQLNSRDNKNIANKRDGAPRTDEELFCWGVGLELFLFGGSFVLFWVGRACVFPMVVREFLCWHCVICVFVWIDG